MPDNIVLVLGFPRSGTTMLTRAIGNHSKVDTLMEPYQVRRDAGFSSDDVRLVASECRVKIDPARSILLKETFQRIPNVQHSFALLDRAARAGVNCGTVLILRSPVEAFLSQVEAAATLWKRKSEMSVTPRDVEIYWRKMRGAFAVFFANVFRYTHRVILYDRFIGNAVTETSRIMAAIGYHFEPAQLEFGGETETRKIAGGDPKTYAPGRTVKTDSRTDRSKEVAEFIQMMKDTPGGKQLIDFHNHLLELNTQTKISDTRLLMDIFLRHGDSFGAPVGGAAKGKAQP